MISEVDLRDWGDYPQRPIESKEQYEHYLKNHDWYYEYSDDHESWRAGLRTAAYLIEARKHFDRDFALWGQYSPWEEK